MGVLPGPGGVGGEGGSGATAKIHLRRHPNRSLLEIRGWCTSNFTILRFIRLLASQNQIPHRKTRFWHALPDIWSAQFEAFAKAGCNPEVHMCRPNRGRDNRIQKSASPTFRHNSISVTFASSSHHRIGSRPASSRLRLTCSRCSTTKAAVLGTLRCSSCQSCHRRGEPPIPAMLELWPRADRHAVRLQASADSLIRSTSRGAWCHSSNANARWLNLQLDQSSKSSWFRFDRWLGAVRLSYCLNE